MGVLLVRLPWWEAQINSVLLEGERSVATLLGVKCKKIVQDVGLFMKTFICKI